ncbi:serine/threonine protein kinase [Tenggerimyces flavus]|nr:protein kinase [Tenggerimyces flavus]MBM7790098.1 serine/threonine protein kinase [Tenggerimyces flavus]
MAHRRLSGRYDLEKLVGHGGMADVWRAHDRRLGRVVAVKVLRADLASDPTFPERLRREARSVARLNHPHIVDVYDAGVDTLDGAELPYLVMEYVTGRTLSETLSELLRDGQRLTPDRAMEIAARILDALEYSHEAGIVHRDVKPGNVMLTSEGLVKVMDFGIALAMSDSADLTKTDQVLGTARYLSPEQALGIPVDGRSDVYSTGCLLYELLTARPPFVGDSTIGVAYQHVQEEALSPQAIDPRVPELYAAIVLRALAKDPAERYQTAAQMRADIESALHDLPAMEPPEALESMEAVDTAGTVAAVEPGRRAQAPTNPVTAAVAAAAAALALAGGTFLLLNWPGLGPPQGPGTVPGESVPGQIGDTRPPLQRDNAGADTSPAAEVGARVDDKDVDVQRQPNPGPSDPPDEPSPEPSGPNPKTSPPAPTVAPTPREPKPVPTNPSPTPNDTDPATPTPSTEPSEPEPSGPNPETSPPAPAPSESTPSPEPTEEPLEPSPSGRR